MSTQVGAVTALHWNRCSFPFCVVWCFPMCIRSRLPTVKLWSVSKIISLCFTGISSKSLRILSFHNNTSLLLINRCLILRLVFPGRDSGVPVLDCLSLPLPAQAEDTITDVQLCRRFLFVLSTLGRICILDCERWSVCRGKDDVERWAVWLSVGGTRVKEEWLDFSKNFQGRIIS